MTKMRRNRRSNSRILAFLVAFCIPGMFVVAMNVPQVFVSGTAGRFDLVALAAYAFICVPLLTAGAVAFVRHRLQPRHMFSVSGEGRHWAFLRGLAAGTISMGIVGAVVVLTSVNVRLEWLVFAVTFPSVWLSLEECAPEVVPFACGHCAYDLRGSLAAGRCPECGNEFDSPTSATMPTGTLVSDAA